MMELIRVLPGQSIEWKLDEDEQMLFDEIKRLVDEYG